MKGGPMRVECAHGDGNTQGPRTTSGAVGAARGAAPGCESSFLSALEAIAGGEPLRRVRGRGVPAVLCGEAGAAEPRARDVFPAAADRLLRGYRLGAWDGMAGERLAGPAAISAGGVGGVTARAFHDLAEAAADGCGDTPGSVHLGAGGAGGERTAAGAEAGDRRHHVGGERSAADDCAAGYGRRVSGISEAAGAGLGDCDADAGTVGATG